MPLRGTSDDEHRQRPVASPLPRAGPWGGGLPRGPMVGWEGPGVGGAPASFSREGSDPFGFAQGKACERRGISCCPAPVHEIPRRLGMTVDLGGIRFNWAEYLRSCNSL
jgi:hypothetical protein